MDDLTISSEQDDQDVFTGPTTDRAAAAPDREELALWRDVAQTRREIGGWSGLGTERCDPTCLVGLLAFSAEPIHVKTQCLAAKALQLRGWTPVAITRPAQRSARAMFELFGIDRFVDWNEPGECGVVATDGDAEAAARMLPARLTMAQARALAFHGVGVGALALAQTCRTLFDGHLEFDDRATRALFHETLTAAIRAVLAAERLLERQPLQKLIVRDIAYLPNGAIYQAALLRGVDCIVHDEGQKQGTWVFRRSTWPTRNELCFSIAWPTWTRIRQQPWTEADERGVDAIFRRRYDPESQDDVRRLQLGKQARSPEQVGRELGLTPGRKTAVVFAHLAWHAAFYFDSPFFDDFDDWLFHTIKFAAAECPQLDWVIKLHPCHGLRRSAQPASEDAELRSLHALMPLPAHVKLLRAETEINTSSLFPVADYVVTVNGTVGMEFPCFGVPAVVAGAGRYRGMGFTIDPSTRDAYFRILETLHERPRLDRSAIELARRHFRALIVERQVSFDSVAAVELNKLHEGMTDVHNNLRVTVRSLDEFQAAPVIRRLAEWLDGSREPDFMES